MEDDITLCLIHSSDGVSCLKINWVGPLTRIRHLKFQLIVFVASILPSSFPVGEGFWLIRLQGGTFLFLEGFDLDLGKKKLPSLKTKGGSRGSRAGGFCMSCFRLHQVTNGEGEGRESPVCVFP